jgi:hypothetical protein
MRCASFTSTAKTPAAAPTSNAQSMYGLSRKGGQLPAQPGSRELLTDWSCIVFVLCAVLFAVCSTCTGARSQRRSRYIAFGDLPGGYDDQRPCSAVLPTGSLWAGRTGPAGLCRDAVLLAARRMGVRQYAGPLLRAVGSDLQSHDHSLSASLLPVRCGEGRPVAVRGQCQDCHGACHRRACSAAVVLRFARTQTQTHRQTQTRNRRCGDGGSGLQRVSCQWRCGCTRGCGCERGCGRCCFLTRERRWISRGPRSRSRLQTRARGLSIPDGCRSLTPPSPPSPTLPVRSLLRASLCHANGSPFSFVFLSLYQLCRSPLFPALL